MKKTLLLLFGLMLGIGQTWGDTYLTSLNSINDDNKYTTYTICDRNKKRAYLYADVSKHRLDGCGITRSAFANVAQNDDDVKQQFAFIKYNNNYYLYSVGDKRFATWTSSNERIATLVEVPTVENGAITLTPASQGENCVIMKIITAWFNFSTSYEPDVYMNYNTEDDGNRILIKATNNKLSEAEYNEALEKLNANVNVIYHVTFDGTNVVKTATIEQTVGTPITIENAPAAIRNDYVSFTAVDKNIVSKGDDGIVTYTAAIKSDCPITFSNDFSTATWYQAKFNEPNTNWAYNPNHTNDAEGLGYSSVTNAIDLVNDSALWAFSGNPYAVHIWNRGAGENYELHLAKGARPRIEHKNKYNEGRKENGKSIEVDLSTANSDGRYDKWLTWVLGKSTNGTGNSYLVSDGSYLNNRNNTLGTWTSPQATGGSGSAISFILSDDIYQANIFNNISTDIPTASSNPKWGDIAKVQVNVDASAFTAARTAYNSNPNHDNYNAVINSLASYALGGTVKAVDYTATYKGSDGWVNIYSTNTGTTDYSIGLYDDETSATNTNNKKYEAIHAKTTNKNDVAQMWLVTSTQQGKVRLFNADARKYIGSIVGGTSNTTLLSDTPSDFYIFWKDDGSFVLSNANDENATGNNGNPKHLNFETNTANYGNLNTWAGNDKWKAEPLPDGTITLHDIGSNSYATLCLPFEATVSGATAYTEGNLDGTTLKLNAVTNGVIPAGTPVVLIGEAGAGTATISNFGTTTSAAAEGTFIRGTLLPMAWSYSTEAGADGTNDTGLSFGKATIDGVPTAGFFRWNGTKLSANKAYIPASALTTSTADAKGIMLEFDDNNGTVTRIDAETLRQGMDGNADAPRYNLAGQRVSNAYKGVVIAGGKKFMAK